jgi:hypothetical protein
MGIQRGDGYSASVEAYLVVGDRRISVAKTSRDAIVLAEPAELIAGTTGELEVVVDGHLDSRRIVIESDCTFNERVVRYREFDLI